MTTSKFKAQLKKRRKNQPDRRNLFSKTLNFGLISSPAFQGLTSSSKSILFMCILENERIAYSQKEQRTPAGKPYFKWSAEDSIVHLNISGRNHFKSITQLKDVGFLELHKSGGLKGCNGTANYFVLSGLWWRWTPKSKQVSKSLLVALAKGRETALKRKKQIQIVTPINEQKPVNKSSQVRMKIALNVCSLVASSSDAPLQPGHFVYYKRPEDRRALKAELVCEQGECWEVRGARTATNIIRPILVIPTQYLRTVDAVKNAK